MWAFLGLLVALALSPSRAGQFDPNILNGHFFTQQFKIKLGELKIASKASEASEASEASPPTITHPPSGKTVLDQGTVTFLCGVSDLHAETSWLKNGRRIKERMRRYAIKQSLNVSALTIKPVNSILNNKTFTCVAANTQGESRAGAQLTVIPNVKGREAPAPGFPVISLHPKRQSVAIGEDVVFQCEAKGDPRCVLSMQWLKNSLPVNRSDARFRILDTGQLQITNSRQSDMGKYECVAKNKHGVAHSRRADLRFSRDPPSRLISRDPPSLRKFKDISVVVGAEVILICDSIGGHMCQHTWRLGDTVLTRKKGKNVLVLKARVSQNYTCEVSSQMTTVKQTMRVRVIVWPHESPPSDVTAWSISATTILVNWAEDPATNGVLAGYSVYYTDDPAQPISSWDRRTLPAHPPDWQNDRRMTTITGLRGGVIYTISVVAFSAVSQGPMSQLIRVLTPYSVAPPAPVIFSTLIAGLHSQT